MTEETKGTLEQQFKRLEHDWKSYKQSQPRRTKHRSPCSKGTVSDSIMSEGIQLMRSLLQAYSPAQESQNISKPDGLATQEIVEDRKAAKERCELKGKRLFQEFNGCSSTESAACSRHYSFSSSSSSFTPPSLIGQMSEEDEIVEETGIVGQTVMHKFADTNNFRACTVFSCGIAVVCIIFAVYFDILYGYQEEMVPVPT